jgi:hypothetical protein
MEQDKKWEVWMCEMRHKIEPDGKQILNTSACMKTSRRIIGFLDFVHRPKF